MSEKKKIAVDVDGTLTHGEARYWIEDEEPQPRHEVIEAVNNLYKAGHFIIIWTARPWTVAEQTAAWLRKWGVRYHGLRMAKGSADVYIDDKAVHVEDFIAEGAV